MSWTFYNSSGEALVQNAESEATQAEVEAETAGVKFVPPDLLRHHPGVSKCWAINSADGATVLASYNLSSLTDGGTGNRTYVFDDDFSSVNWSAVGSPGNPAGNDTQALIFGQNVRTAASTDCLVRSSGSAGLNIDAINFVAFFGDQ